jgi:hypothetical protein
MKRFLLLHLFCSLFLVAAQSPPAGLPKEIELFEALFQEHSNVGKLRDALVNTMALESEDTMFVVTRIDGVANKSADERAKLLTKQRASAKKWLRGSRKSSPLDKFNVESKNPEALI